MANVTGPSSSTDIAIARWDGTTGTVIQDSSVLVDSAGNISTPGAITSTGNYFTALNFNTTYNDSVVIGNGLGGTGGTDNAVIGNSAGTGGDYNVVIGSNAGGGLSSGTSNVIIGAGTHPYDGSDEVAIGAGALASASGSGANVAIGLNAGASMTSAGGNVLIGPNAGNGTLTTGTANIIIGGGFDAPAASTSYYLNIGGVITGQMDTVDITLADGFHATTQSPLDDSTNIATTAYVDAAVAAGGGGSGTVTSVAASGTQGVTISGSPITTSGTITVGLGNITPTTVNGVTLSGSSSPSLAVTGTTSVSGSNTGDQTITLTGNVTGSGTGSFATTIASSVSLSGSPTTTTQSSGDNSTKIATTAFVAAAVAGPGNSITLGTPTAFNSGTSYTVTGLPTGIRQLNMMLQNVTVSSNSNMLFQIGTSGGLVTTGYTSNGVNTYSGSVSASPTAGIVSYYGAGSYTINGKVTFNLVDATNNIWVASYVFSGGGSGGSNFGGGTVTLSSTLSQIRFTTVGGSATWNGGKINISYQ
jgi:hypothetical protein